MIALVVHLLVQLGMDATSTMAIAVTGSVQPVTLMLGVTLDVGAPSCRHHDIGLRVGDVEAYSDPEPCE